MGAIGRESGGAFAPDQTGGLHALVAMGLALLLVALLTDLELKPITALRTFRHLNALGIWAFWTVLLFQTSEVIVTLAREGTRNSTGLVWCGVSVGLAFIALSLWRSLLEVGRSVIEVERRSRRPPV